MGCGGTSKQKYIAPEVAAAAAEMSSETMGAEPSGGVKRNSKKSPTLLSKLTRTVDFKLEEDWVVGGKYEVAERISVMSSTSSQDACEVCELKPLDQVMLLSLKTDEGPLLGFVLPPGSKHGWVNLDRGCVTRARLAESWMLRARYRANHTCTLRVDKDLNSPVVCDIEEDQEVLVLGIGLDCDLNENKARLRMYVQVANTEELGWLSPEPSPGVRLLDPVDLLSEKAVEQHKKSLAGKGEPIRRSIANSDGLPWQVGCQYRVLEKLQLRQEADLSSPDMGKVLAGELVTVQGTNKVQCPDLGMCPSVLVIVNEGILGGERGWLRCAAKDGHDVIDVRDQLGFEKAMASVRKSQQELIVPPRSAEQIAFDVQDGEEPELEEEKDTEEKASGDTITVFSHAHPLSKFDNGSTTWHCDDKCASCTRDADGPSQRWSCRQCGYDLCRGCSTHHSKEEYGQQEKENIPAYDKKIMPLEVEPPESPMSLKIDLEEQEAEDRRLKVGINKPYEDDRIKIEKESIGSCLDCSCQRTCARN